MRPIRSFRLVASLASWPARSRSAARARSASPCAAWRAATSAPRRSRSPTSDANALASPSFSWAMLVRRRTISLKSVASASVSLRNSGKTAPSKIDVRIAASMSSGPTSTAGGGLRPMRCNAASTSAMTPRRLSSDRLMASSLPPSASSLCSASLTLISKSLTLAPVSSSAALNRARSARIVSISISMLRRCRLEASSVSCTPRNSNCLASMSGLFASCAATGAQASASAANSRSVHAGHCAAGHCAEGAGGERCIKTLTESLARHHQQNMVASRRARHGRIAAQTPGLGNARP